MLLFFAFALIAWGVLGLVLFSLSLSNRSLGEEKIGHFFGGSFYRNFYLSHADFGHFCMVVQSLNPGLT